MQAFLSNASAFRGESGAIYQDASGRWVAPDDIGERGLPQSVRQVIGYRIERLGPDARRVLSQAAVIGRDFDLDLGMLATVLGRPDDAERHFQTAHDISERLRAPFWIASTNLEHARVLLINDAAPERARSLLDQTLTTAHDYGFARLAQQATVLLDTIPDGSSDS